MHSYAERGQKTFLISTLVDLQALSYLSSQKTFLISTLVDKTHLTSRRLSKDLFNFYSCRFAYLDGKVRGQKTFLISTLVDSYCKFESR